MRDASGSAITGVRTVGVETRIRLTTADTAALHRELQERGVDVGELPRWPGVLAMFALRDADDDGLEIVEQPAAQESR